MSIQSFNYDFTAEEVSSFIDPKTGSLTKVGRYLLLALWNRTGQGTGIVPKVSDPLTATGAAIGDALGLTTDWNFVATVPVGTGVQIMALKPGNDIEVYNAGANNLNVYPPVAFSIDALAVNQAYVLTPGKLRIFQCWTLSQFISLGN